MLPYFSVDFVAKRIVFCFSSNLNAPYTSSQQVQYKLHMSKNQSKPTGFHRNNVYLFSKKHSTKQIVRKYEILDKAHFKQLASLSRHCAVLSVS